MAVASFYWNHQSIWLHFIRYSINHANRRDKLPNLFFLFQHYQYIYSNSYWKWCHQSFANEKCHNTHEECLKQIYIFFQNRQWHILRSYNKRFCREVIHSNIIVIIIIIIIIIIDNNNNICCPIKDIFFSSDCVLKQTVKKKKQTRLC